MTIAMIVGAEHSHVIFLDIDSAYLKAAMPKTGPSKSNPHAHLTRDSDAAYQVGTEHEPIYNEEWVHNRQPRSSSL